MSAPGVVDVRGPRFVAWVTTAVLVVALLVSTRSGAAAAVILAAQTAVFAVGALAGSAPAPLRRALRCAGRPAVGGRRPNANRSPPLRFAQLVGFVFAAVGTLGFASGLVPLGLVATGLALVAALLNAAFGICLGCQLYPLVASPRA